MYLRCSRLCFVHRFLLVYIFSVRGIAASTYILSFIPSVFPTLIFLCIYSRLYMYRRFFQHCFVQVIPIVCTFVVSGIAMFTYFFWCSQHILSQYFLSFVPFLFPSMLCPCISSRLYLCCFLHCFVHEYPLVCSIGVPDIACTYFFSFVPLVFPLLLCTLISSRF